jgi:thiol-disulfide isomerase/thioredoxin
VLAFSTIAHAAFGQSSSVSFFVNADIENALAMAQKQDKDIFVDTYAQWCGPCKKLAKSFLDDDVANYFNRKFINVKYDMETDEGREIYRRYDVIFLPTILILDKYGNVKLKVDNRVIPPEELLSLARAVTEPYTPPVTEYAANEVISSSPARKKTSVTTSVPVVTQNQETAENIVATPESVVKKPGEKILYVLNTEGQIPPDILYEEAYFRMQLMDGSHRRTVKNYLDTQDDWSTEKNMKFISDFVYDTDTKEFQYIMDNYGAFVELIGEEKIDRTVDLLVYNKLYNGYPRPDLEKTKLLLSYVDPNNIDKNSNLYYLNRLHEADKTEEYIEVAENYLSFIAPEDFSEMSRLAKVIARTKSDKKSRKKSLQLIEDVIAENPDNYQYYEDQAIIYLMYKDKKNALKSAEQALAVAKANGKNYDSITTLIATIIAL